MGVDTMTAHTVKIVYDGVTHHTVLPSKEAAVLFARRWFLGTFITEDDGNEDIINLMLGRDSNGAICNSAIARTIAIGVHTAWMDFPEFVEHPEAVFETSSKGVAIIGIREVK